MVFISISSWSYEYFPRISCPRWTHRNRLKHLSAHACTLKEIKTTGGWQVLRRNQLSVKWLSTTERIAVPAESTELRLECYQKISYHALNYFELHSCTTSLNLKPARSTAKLYGYPYTIVYWKKNKQLNNDTSDPVSAELKIPFEKAMEYLLRFIQHSSFYKHIMLKNWTFPC